jgi:hypothetical protein
MRRKARGAAIALAASTLIAGLLAPSAVAKKTIYSGQLLGPATEQPGSVIGFKVVSAGKGRKLHPVTVLKLNMFWYTFAPGNAAPGPIPLCRDPQGNRAEPFNVAYASFEMRIPVNKRAFAVSRTNPAPYGYSGSETYEIRGRIPRKGPATGTVRYTGSWAVPDTGQVTCDSTTSWKANAGGEAITLE